jgi:hypothetical protein
MAHSGNTGALLRAVQASGEDFEWYPTTERMVQVVARWLDKTAGSIMDIGAGDGRVLAKLAERFEKTPDLYAIEKSTVLVQAQPENIIPVGTDLFEQNLACLPVDYIFSNPPYSEFEAWACMIVDSGHARKAFLVLPQRWKENEAIAQSLKKRRATARVLHSDDFLDGPRRARAVVDVVEVSFPLKDEGRGWGREVQDPFDAWFDATISTFDQEDEHLEDEVERESLARVRRLGTIAEMVEAYREEYERMEANYRAIFQLDYALLRELGVNKDNVRDGIKKKMAGLKAKYWTVLFERLDAITNRLSTATKARFTDRLVGRVATAFTANNAYAVVLWAIKNANAYLSEQTVALYRDLSTFENVMRYKSNVRTWGKDAWRYSRHDPADQKPSHYALDYRIVLEKYRAIYTGDRYGFGSYDHPGNLSRGCHELIADVVAVLFNLGFPSEGENSLNRHWSSGQWQDWTRAGRREVLFQVKAYKNGNLHFRFLPDAIKALNVEAGRLLGWLRNPGDVVKELGYSEEEAEQLFACTRIISPGSARLMLGPGMIQDPAVGGTR